MGYSGEPPKFAIETERSTLRIARRRGAREGSGENGERSLLHLCTIILYTVPQRYTRAIEENPQIVFLHAERLAYLLGPELVDGVEHECETGSFTQFPETALELLVEFLPFKGFVRAASPIR